MNLKIREMVATLKKYIEGVELPAEVKRMALKEIYDSVSAEADKAISMEISERDEKEKGEKNE